MFSVICNWLASDTGLIFTLFVCLALGYAIGNVALGPISLGPTVGTLLAAVVIAIAVGSTAQFAPPAALRAIFFDLFIFALGYDVGPAFVRSLKSSGLRLIVMSVLFTVVSLGIGVGCYFFLHLGNGELAGLFAGAMTQSTILGAAQTMMASLGVTGDAATQMNAEMTAAFALGYLLSYAGCVILIKAALPYVLGVKGVPGLKNEVKKISDKVSYKGDPSDESVFGSIRLRTFLAAEDLTLTVGALRQRFDERLQVEALFRGSGDGDPAAVGFDDGTSLRKGDVVALIGDLERMPEIEKHGFVEVTDRKYQKAVIVKAKMAVTKDFGMTAAQAREMFSEHVMPVQAARNGKPLDDLTSFRHGDVVTVMGLKNSVQKVIKAYGYPVNAGADSDVIIMSIGMIAGILIGIVTVNISGIPFSFGASGGVMFLGIFCGWYNGKNPRVGYISPGARWIMKSVGLNVFVACLGLSSGASFVSAIRSMGVNVIIAVFILSFLPHIVTVLLGKYVLRLNPIDALGGICGAGTNTAALNGLVEETGSSLFVAAYTPAYAMGNIVLTFLGTISVALFH
jgi:putative transport protein